MPDNDGASQDAHGPEPLRATEAEAADRPLEPTRTWPSVSGGRWRWRHRLRWPTAFLVLNVLGLATVLWRVEAANRAGRELAVAGFLPGSPAEPESTRELSVELDAPVDSATLGTETLRLVPHVTGRTMLGGPRTLVYALDEKLKGATAYRLEFSPQLRGAAGELPPRRSVFFETPRLRLLGVAQADRRGSDDCTLAFSFSAPVSPDELLRSLTVTSPEKTHPDIEKLGAKPEKNVRVRCRNAPWSRLHVGVAAGLAGIEGPLGLASPYAAEVEISGRLRLLAMHADFDGETPEIRVHMNAPVEAASAERFVNIDPPVKFAAESDYQGLVLKGPFECGGRYTVTLKPGLAAGAVRPLAVEASRTVWFPDMPESLRFSGEGGYLSPSGLLKVPVRSTNVTRLSVGIQKLHAHNVVEYVLARDEGDASRLCAGAPRTEIRAAGDRNREVETLLDMREMIARAFPAKASPRTAAGQGDAPGSEGADGPAAADRPDERTDAADAPEGGRIAAQPAAAGTAPPPSPLSSPSSPSSPHTGIYCLDLQGDAERWWGRETALIVVTDLGVSARIWEGGALLWVTSIATGRPVEGARATVYSSCRVPLGSGTTDSTGRVALQLAPPAEDDEPAVVVVERGADLSYLNLDRGERSRGEAAAEGREFLSRGYEVSASSERGAYRPGDTAHLWALVRGERLAVPPAMPLEVEVTKPGGRRLARFTAMSDASGRLAVDVPIPAGAPTGRYRASWRLPGSDKSLGACSFLVADYMPRTLRMKLEAAGGRLPAREPFKVTAEVRHLFGDSAAGLAAGCRARFAARDFAPAGWEAFKFGDPRKKRGEARSDLAERRLDGSGRTVFELRPPQVETPAAVRAEVDVEVLEPGGRALSERLVRDLDPWPFYVGVKPPGKSSVAGTAAVFEVAAVRPDGKAVEAAGRYSATLYRVVHNRVLQRVGRGRLEYADTPHEELVATITGETPGGRAEVRVAPERSGEHRLVVEVAGGCPASCDFFAGGPGNVGGAALADPESIHLSLDKAAYRPGETARLSVRAPFGGTLLLAVETDRVLESRVTELPAGGEGDFDFAVSEQWRPNAFLTATVLRAAEPEEEWRPHRASGVVRLALDNSDRRLKLEVESPTDARPEREVELAVRVLGADGAIRPGAAVVLSAVDEGVLALTGFRSPDPFGFFYANRRLPVREHDMYSRLAPELVAWKAAAPAAPGGDAGPEEAADDDTGSEMSRRLSPVEAGRVRTAVLWAGALTAGPDGVARTRLRVPEYVGELRVMAAAAADGDFGTESRPLPVRSPLMVRASWPRFASPGDEFDVPVTVFNRTAADGRATLAVTGVAEAGPTADASAHPDAPRLVFVEKPPAEVEIPAGGERTVRLRVRAGAVGKASIRLALALGDEGCSDSLELPVRPATPMAKRCGTVLVAAGEETRITPDAEFHPGTARCSLVVGASPVVELSGALGWLLEYPYGCVEQTTSRLVPLIYLRDLAALSAPGALGSGDVEGPLAAGFARLELMQTTGGGLGYWPGAAEEYPWGSVYAADVLLEARKAGHEVPAELLDPLLRYLRGRLDVWAATDSRGAARDDDDDRPEDGGEAPAPSLAWRQGQGYDPALAAYACYVLARSGQPPHAWMATLEEKFRRDAKSVPTGARFHLAAAFLAAGQAGAARNFVADARPNCRLRDPGGCLDSPTREAAVMLSVLLDVDPGSTQVPALAERLRKGMRLGHWGTTQDNAFALMALGKHARRLGEASELGGTAVLPDGSERKFGPREGLCLENLPPGSSVLVRASGGRGRLTAFWQADGVPKDGRVREEDSGLSVRREILSADGRATVKPSELVQGRLYQVRLVVESSRWADNVVVTDLLPAGLEIENPELAGSAPAAGSAEGKEPPKGVERLRARHVERRDDRLLVFADMWSGKAEYRYAVRAVAAGRFVLPPVQAECMYDPGIYSTHGAGRIEVQAR